MVVSLLWRTTSNTLHFVPPFSAGSPNRDALPTFERGIDIVLPVFASRAYAILSSSALGLGLQLILLLDTPPVVSVLDPALEHMSLSRGESLSTLSGTTDGCNGLRRLVGSGTARSKLHEEYLVKKLSPHFH